MIVLAVFFTTAVLGVDLNNFASFGKKVVGAKLSIFLNIGPRMCMRECHQRKKECGSINFNKQNLLCELNVLQTEESLHTDPDYFIINVTNFHTFEEGFEKCTEVDCGMQHKCSTLKQNSAVCTKVLSTDCYQHHQQGALENGVYRIYPTSAPMDVYCDMRTEGGGWTTIYRRIYPFTLSFNRSWEEYKEGYGDLDGEHWLGNDKIHILTTYRPSEALFELEALNSMWHLAKYRQFIVGSETDNYRLDFDEESYIGNAGDSLHSTVGWESAKGEQFSTYDKDNDNYSSNCANDFACGWWFNSCSYSMVNGKETDGMWTQYLGQIKGSGILLRPVH